MNSFKVSDIKPGVFFTDDVTIDKTFLLLNNEIPVSEELLKALNDWSLTEVYSEGSIGTADAAKASEIPEAAAYLTIDCTASLTVEAWMVESTK